jgi:hypothetical protein
MSIDLAKPLPAEAFLCAESPRIGAPDVAEFFFRRAVPPSIPAPSEGQPAIINILIDALARQLRRLIFQCRLLPSEFERPDRLRPLFLAVAPSFALSDLFSDKVAAVRRDQGGVSSTIKRGLSMLGLILLIILILLLLGGLPSWGYSRSWGYGPSGVLGLVLVIVLVLVLLGRV